MIFFFRCCMHSIVFPIMNNAPSINVASSRGPPNQPTQPQNQICGNNFYGNRGGQSGGRGRGGVNIVLLVKSVERWGTWKMFVIIGRTNILSLIVEITQTKGPTLIILETTMTSHLLLRLLHTMTIHLSQPEKTTHMKIGIMTMELSILWPQLHKFCKSNWLWR